MNFIREFWHRLQGYHSFRVYYRDGRHTYLVRWDVACGLAGCFGGTIKFEPR